MSQAVLDHVRSRPDLALPAYVTDLPGLSAHAARVRAALPAQLELLYAAKANPDPEVLRALAPHFDGVEVASGGELEHVAAALPGVALSFGGPGKTEADLELAVRSGVHRLHVESRRELDLLARLAARTGRAVDVLLRVNAPLPVPDAPLAMGGGPSPFGLDPGDLDAAAAAARAAGLRLRGLHLHLASGLNAPACAELAAAAVAWACAWSVRTGHPLDELNFGGGMAVDYANPDARFDWDTYGAALSGLVRQHPGLRLKVEPGRALTAYGACYVTRVLDVKRSHGRTFAVVLGGTHHLRTPAARGHDQPLTVVPSERWPADLPRPAAPPGPVTLVGQLCTPKDVLARDAPVPALRAGDVVAFSLAGAYAWNISHTAFLMHPPPAFLYLQPTAGDQPRARRAGPAAAA